jgi:hypothetical protein
MASSTWNRALNAALRTDDEGIGNFFLDPSALQPLAKRAQIVLAATAS